MSFVKRVDAIQWNGENLDDIRGFCDCVKYADGILCITLNGSDNDVHETDWLVKDSQGIFSIETADNFAAIYTEIED